MKAIKNITIAIASYNRPILLQETLKSIESLGLLINVLIIDDNSPRYAEILKVIGSFESSNVDIMIHRNEHNLGEVETKKKLFSLIKSKYFFLLGDDDTLDPGARNIFLLYDELKIELDFIFFGYRIINEDNKVLKTRKSLIPISSTEINANSLNTFSRYVTFPFYYFHPALYMADTATALKLSLDSSIGIGEDYDLLWRIMNQPNIRWIISPSVIVNWRKHAVQLANQSSSLQNRLDTKTNILKKYENSSIPLSRFWFVLIPTFFDVHSGLDISNVGVSPAERKILSLGNSVLPRFLGALLYKTYKVYEYSVVQIKHILR